MTSDNNYEKRKTKKASQIHFEFWMKSKCVYCFSPNNLFYDNFDKNTARISTASFSLVERSCQEKKTLANITEANCCLANETIFLTKHKLKDEKEDLVDRHTTGNTAPRGP